MADGIQLIVGLGNPGSEYARTRHNVGAWFVTRWAQEKKQPLQREKKFFGAVAKLIFDDQYYWLFQPSTFMNESGKAVAAIANFYKIPPQKILIVHDELDFAVGKIRLKYGGGHGGHNGLDHIIQAFGTPDFYRLRIGIGHPGHKDQVTPYVLSAPSSDDENKITTAIDNSFKIIPFLISGNFEKAMRELHRGI